MSSKVRCLNCYGDGTVDCPSCDNKYSIGRFFDNLLGYEPEMCVNCHNDFVVRCPDCQGTGEVDDDED